MFEFMQICKPGGSTTALDLRQDFFGFKTRISLNFRQGFCEHKQYFVIYFHLSVDLIQYCALRLDVLGLERCFDIICMEFVCFCP